MSVLSKKMHNFAFGALRIIFLGFCVGVISAIIFYKIVIPNFKFHNKIQGRSKFDYFKLDFGKFLILVCYLLSFDFLTPHWGNSIEKTNNPMKELLRKTHSPKKTYSIFEEINDTYNRETRKHLKSKKYKPFKLKYHTPVKCMYII